jgi:cell division protein FtsL
MPHALARVSTVKYVPARRKTKAKTKNSYFSYNKKVFRASLLFFVLFVGFFIYNLYLNLQLVEINFSLRKFSKQSERLEVQIQNLESRIIGITSLDNIKKSIKPLEFVEAKDIKFVKIPVAGGLSLEK